MKTNYLLPKIIHHVFSCKFFFYSRNHFRAAETNIVPLLPIKKPLLRILPAFPGISKALLFSVILCPKTPYLGFPAEF